MALFLDVMLAIAAYLYARFVFSEYLRGHHTKHWEEMVYGDEYRGSNILAFDKTPAVWRFRCKSNDDLGDPNIARMRRISIYLFNAAMIAWLTMVGIFLVSAVLFALVFR